MFDAESVAPGETGRVALTLALDDAGVKVVVGVDGADVVASFFFGVDAVSTATFVAFVGVVVVVVVAAVFGVGAALVVF